MRKARIHYERLKPFLDAVFQAYHQESLLESDPLEFPHRFRDPFDQEAVALVSALLAYGNVKQIRASVASVLERIAKTDSSPAQFVRALSGKPGRQRARRAFGGFVHRFNREEDLVELLTLLARSWERHGSLGGHLVSRLAPTDPDFSAALNALIADWRSWASTEAGPYFGHLLTAPEDGSCCKRWCMLLRWMGRNDVAPRLDLGLWSQGGALAGTFPPGRFLSSAQLVIPLDTHTGRISQYLGLTERKSLDWKAALEVTDALRACDPADPVRYDFSLCRLGILDLCKRAFRPEVCQRCQLLPVCRFAAKRIKIPAL